MRCAEVIDFALLSVYFAPPNCAKVLLHLRSVKQTSPPTGSCLCYSLYAVSDFSTNPFLLLFRDYFRYDGLYTVTKMWDSDGNTTADDIPVGGSQYTFYLERLPTTPMPPFVAGQHKHYNLITVNELWKKIQIAKGYQQISDFVSYHANFSTLCKLPNDRFDKIISIVDSVEYEKAMSCDSASKRSFILSTLKSAICRAHNEQQDLNIISNVTLNDKNKPSTEQLERSKEEKYAVSSLLCFQIDSCISISGHNPSFRLSSQAQHETLRCTNSSSSEKYRRQVRYTDTIGYDILYEGSKCSSFQLRDAMQVIQITPLAINEIEKFLSKLLIMIVDEIQKSRRRRKKEKAMVILPTTKRQKKKQQPKSKRKHPKSSQKSKNSQLKMKPLKKKVKQSGKLKRNHSCARKSDETNQAHATEKSLKFL